MTTENRTSEPLTMDCIALKRRVQREIYEATRHMSPDEELGFYKRRAEEGPLGDWWRSVRRATGSRVGRVPPAG